MLKFIIICTKAIVIAIVALLFSSCKSSDNYGNSERIDGNKIVKTEDRTPPKAFTKIEVSRGLSVTVEQASESSVVVEADENLLPHILIKEENGTLKVTSDRDMYNFKTRNIKIKVAQIESLSSDSGCSVKSVNTLKGTSLKLHSDSGSTLEVSAEYDSIDADCDSGSTLKVAGKSLKLKAHSDSGSSLNARNLLSNDVVATSDSGSSLSVHALQSIKASADSGASIRFSGDPKQVSKSEDSGGSVNKE